jgi:hypothetical protein
MDKKIIYLIISVSVIIFIFIISRKKTKNNIEPEIKKPKTEDKPIEKHNNTHNPNKIINFYLISLSEYNKLSSTIQTDDNNKTINVYFNIENDNGDVNLEKYRYISTQEYHILNVDIPDVNKNAFVSQKMFDEIVFTNNVKSIGENAFSQCNIKKITLSNFITTIGENAFSFNSLTDINIPTSMSKLNNSTFSNNKIKKVIIPNNITYIGKNCFSENHIEELELSDSSRLENEKLTIDNYAFYDNKINSLNIGSNIIFGNYVPHIPKQANIRYGEYCFSHNQINYINIDSNLIELIPYEAFSYNKINNIDFLNKNNITTIDSFAFKENIINNINIPINIKTINNGAFSYNSIDNFTNFGSITSIDSEVFNYGDKYSNQNFAINVDISDNIYTIFYLSFANFKNNLNVTSKNITRYNATFDNQFYNTKLNFTKS